MWKHNQKCRKDKNSHLPLPADVKELYERHNLIEAPNFVKNHLCGHCGQAFAKRETMLNHCKNYGQYHDYKCANDNCDFVYWSWEEHKEHCDLKHGGQLMVRCGNQQILCFFIHPWLWFIHFTDLLKEVYFQLKLFHSNERCLICLFPSTKKRGSQ